MAATEKEVSPFPFLAGEPASPSPVKSPEKETKEVAESETILETQRHYFVRNLFIVVVAQITCTFNYFLFSYLTNLFA